MTSAREVVTLGAALGCGVVAGVFFAFSTFVMSALARLAPAEGIAAMQSINRTAISPLFVVALFGTAIACAGLGVWAILAWGESGTDWTLAAAALYLAGSIAVTVGANVPRHDALASVASHDVAAASAWDSYVRSWTAWNHVRTVAALAAAALLIVALAEGFPH